MQAQSWLGRCLWGYERGEWAEQCRPGRLKECLGKRQLAFDWGPTLGQCLVKLQGLEFLADYKENQTQGLQKSVEATNAELGRLREELAMLHPEADPEEVRCCSLAAWLTRSLCLLLCLREELAC